MSRNIYGYARVSTINQKEDRQLISLLQKNIHNSCIYVDKFSGKDFNRPAYIDLLKQIKKGDLLYIVSIDRLGRNYEDIQNQWQLLTKVIEIDISVIDMPLLDTQKNKDLMGNFISDIVLQILSFVAQSEHESIKKRQSEGILAAKARGVKFGRPSKPLPPNFYIVYHDWKKGNLTATKAAIKCNMPLSTFIYKCNLIKENL